MKHLDLFTGIGGFALAAGWAGIETVGMCELDPFCQAVLRKNFPGVPLHNNIKELNGHDYSGIDLITGGYPCQPFSVAGKQKAKADDRHLWPEMHRVIAQAKPAWVICENVYGHVAMGLDDVLHDLEHLGYATQPFVIPALASGANHNRERIFIVAYAPSDGLHESAATCCDGTPDGDFTQGAHQNIYHEGCGGVRPRLDWRGCPVGAWGTEPPALRVDDGLPHRMDRNRALGNAIAPQVAYQLMKLIGGTHV